MRLLRLTIFSGILISSLSISAQVLQERPVKKFKLLEIGVLLGEFSQNTPVLSIDDYKKLAANSALSKADLSGFGLNNYSDRNLVAAISTFADFDIWDKKKSAYKGYSHLRIGLTYLAGMRISGNIYKETKLPIDTLISTQTGQSVFVDKITNDSYYIKYTSDQIRIDAALFIGSDPTARWYFYSGIGTSVGVAFNISTISNYIHYERKQYSDSLNNYYPYDFYTDSINGISENISKNKSTFSVAVYIPFGVDFRMARYGRFWKKIHWFYELKAGMNIQPIPELRTYTNAFVQNQLGIKYSLR